MVDQTEAEKLFMLLAHARVPLMKWGRGASKTFNDLLQEKLNGEAEIGMDWDGSLCRKIRVLLLDVLYHNVKQHKLYYLVEDRQILEGRNETIHREKSCSVSEKLKTNENADEASIARALKEELGIEGGVYFELTQVINEKRWSKNYPGLKTWSQNSRFTVFLSDDQYNPKGYVEHRDGITTYFEWREYDPPLLDMITTKRREDKSQPVFNLSISFSSFRTHQYKCTFVEGR